MFDLDSDPYETTNVSETYPELMRAKQIMAQSRTRSFIDAWNFDFLPFVDPVICNNKQNSQVIDGLNVLAESRDFSILARFLDDERENGRFNDKNR